MFWANACDTTKDEEWRYRVSHTIGGALADSDMTRAVAASRISRASPMVAKGTEGIMDLAAVATRCREETEKFRRQLPSDPAFCLQLWQCALRGATAAEREVAWQYVDAQYRPQMREWFDLHELAPLVEYYGTKDDFAQTVFLKVVKANQQAPLRVDSLREILAYVRTCLINEILMAARRHRPPLDSLDSLDAREPVVGSERRSEDPAHRTARQEEALEIWRRLCACAAETADPGDVATQERQVRLITLRWAQGYPPADIVKTFPLEFSDVHEIFRVLAKIKACYKRKYASAA
jgi:hypothetical protein